MVKEPCVRNWGIRSGESDDADADNHDMATMSQTGIEHH